MWPLSDPGLADSERRLIQSHRSDAAFPATQTDAVNELAERANHRKPGV